jgi:hypothetical protein
MAGLKLDGAGQVKMATLEEAVHAAQALNAQAERFAVAVKANAKNNATYVTAYKRIATPLVGKLKGQFGMIADLVAGSILTVSRPGGGDVLRVRAMREAVAQLKVQLDIAISHVKEKHAKHDDEPSGDG